jgi:hypothetical protein
LVHSNLGDVSKKLNNLSELELTETEIARKPQMTVSGIDYAVRRGEAIAASQAYRLIDT